MNWSLLTSHYWIDGIVLSFGISNNFFCSLVRSSPPRLSCISISASLTHSLASSFLKFFLQQHRIPMSELYNASTSGSPTLSDGLPSVSHPVWSRGYVSQVHFYFFFFTKCLPSPFLRIAVFLFLFLRQSYSVLSRPGSRTTITPPYSSSIVYLA